jgi:hypothetical protein
LTQHSHLKSNIFHLYTDVFWYGIFVGSTFTFIGVYLTRLGANSFQIGLLTAAPGVVNLIISLPIARCSKVARSSRPRRSPRRMMNHPADMTNAINRVGVSLL